MSIKPIFSHFSLYSPLNHISHPFLNKSVLQGEAISAPQQSKTQPGAQAELPSSFHFHSANVEEHDCPN